MRRVHLAREARRLGPTVVLRLWFEAACKPTPQARVCVRAHKTPLGCLSLGRYCGRTPNTGSRRDCGLTPNTGSRRDCGLERAAAKSRRARERDAAQKQTHTHMDIRTWI